MPGEVPARRIISVYSEDHIALRRAQLALLEKGAKVSIAELIHDLMPYLPGTDNGKQQEGLAPWHHRQIIYAKSAAPNAGSITSSGTGIHARGISTATSNPHIGTAGTRD